MQHSRADHENEGAFNLPIILDRETTQLQVRRIESVLKVARVPKARLADVDCRDSGVGLAQRVACGLGRAAAGDQDFLAFAWSLGGPYQMERRRRRSGSL
jgi:hypothetical protein